MTYYTFLSTIQRLAGPAYHLYAQRYSFRRDYDANRTPQASLLACRQWLGQETGSVH